MAERKTEMKLPDGKTVDAFDVPVGDSNEKWSEFELSDGTRLRAKVIITEARRAMNEYDPEGRPMYMISLTPVMVMVEVPERLRQKKQEK